MLTIKTNAVSTATLPTLKRDAMLDNANNGVRFLFDLPFGFCWPDQDAPANGDAVIDVAERANGSYIATGTGVTFAGGGFDYTSLTGGKGYVAGPTDALDAISAGSRYFMAASYMRLPSTADFAITSGSVASIFQAAATNYTAGADMVMIDINTSYAIEFRRQTSGSTWVGTPSPVNVPETLRGRMCQIAVWRNAAGVGLRTIVGSNNAASFAGLSPKWGATPGYGSILKSRLYRGWVEDLSVSGRTPLTVLDDDWTRVQARIAKSAAANGGTSLIFV
jgi:hypothetical protein